MKVLAGVLLLGLTSAAAAMLLRFVAGPALSAGGARKWPTPFTDPGAQWKRDPEHFAGTGVAGYIDGPRRETRSFKPPKIGGWFESGGQFAFRRYDFGSERFYTATGGACGYLDGPFTRARFAGWNYGTRQPREARSPDGRLLYILEPRHPGRMLRRLDLEKREVTTVVKDTGRAIGVALDSKGNLWLPGPKGLRVLAPDGKVLETQPLETVVGGKPVYDFRSDITLDEERRRIYGVCYSGKAGYYVWYWDLAAGGKYVGVLPASPRGKGRAVCVPGPFEGTSLHCPGDGIAFGPDDPEKRYLYVSAGDDVTFYRLDLKEKAWHGFGPLDPKDRPPYETLGFTTYPKRLPFASIGQWVEVMPEFDGEGSIYFGINLWCRTFRFRRVK